MLRPSPNHGTRRLPNDDELEISKTSEQKITNYANYNCYKVLKFYRLPFTHLKFSVVMETIYIKQKYWTFYY